MPGKSNSFSDATSRNPATKEDDDMDNFICLINSKMEESSSVVLYADAQTESIASITGAVAAIKSESDQI